MGQAYEQWTKGKKKPVQNPREPYHLVSLNLRKKLIMMVCEQDVTIYKACKTLKINYSTGKSIIKNYKRKEIVTSKKSEHSEAERPQISQEELQIHQNEGIHQQVAVQAQQEQRPTQHYWNYMTFTPIYLNWAWPLNNLMMDSFLPQTILGFQRSRPY